MVPNYRSQMCPLVIEAASLRGAARRGSRQAAFSLVELLVVVAIIGVLSTIALPRFQAARQAAAEVAIVGNLRTMATNQQLFFLNPVPLRPSSLTDRSQRFARLNELNSFSMDVFGRTVSIYYVDKPGVRYAMVPLNPTIAQLRGQFLIQATQQNVPRGRRGFIYQVDTSGRVVKIRSANF